MHVARTLWNQVSYAFVTYGNSYRKRRPTPRRGCTAVAILFERLYVFLFAVLDHQHNCFAHPEVLDLEAIR